MGKPSVLLNGHKSLVTMLQSAVGNGCTPLRLGRWSARDMRYTFRVAYKSSAKNFIAEAKSRLTAPT